ncbi:MAG TPA: hypothetical protein VJA64_11960, partial [Desulfobaccales bacterium]|nr:hypothetical protein [Desulfobaccales bacterium]
MSALRLAHTRVRPYKTVSFSYFYEHNLVLGGFENLQLEGIYGKRYNTTLMSKAGYSKGKTGLVLFISGIGVS